MTNIQQQYEFFKNNYQNIATEARKKVNIIAILRLLVAIVGIYGAYLFFKTEQSTLVFITLVITISIFLYLVLLFYKYKEKAELHKTLVHINNAELSYLKGDLTPFKNGQVYVQPEHPYSYDLDIFGKGSVFAHINRTTTKIGEQQLAFWLNNNNNIDIAQHQKAVQNLSAKIEWRQHFQAIGQLSIDEDLDKQKFHTWLDEPLKLENARVLRLISYLLPILTIFALIGAFWFDDTFILNIFKYLFISNLVVVGFQQKYIKDEHRQLDKAGSILKKYGLLLQCIENEAFESELLRVYQQRLIHQNIKAGDSITALSKLLNQFDNILNPFALVGMNGLFQYHLHTLFSLEKWKKAHRHLVFDWFDTIGKFEALASIANFAANHADFVFPEKTDDIVLDCKNLGHPLIPSDRRIGNDVAFKDTRFIVLTGSNMSGKSTFLRTLGVNLVLAKIGAPVCAERFVFYPFKICVSMRIDDSLQNSESLFFSELKRLKGIIETLDVQPKSFIILDEILRGTNSNDKRAGTQGLIQRLIAKKAVGIIATHDLVIGDMIRDYPNYIANKCFEAEITKNELYFDYKLRDGICQQMSAAFLMRKMDII